jgi:hypothetical protein
MANVVIEVTKVSMNYFETWQIHSLNCIDEFLEPSFGSFAECMMGLAKNTYHHLFSFHPSEIGWSFLP